MPNNSDATGMAVSAGFMAAFAVFAGTLSGLAFTAPKSNVIGGVIFGLIAIGFILLACLLIADAEKHELADLPDDDPDGPDDVTPALYPPLRLVSADAPEPEKVTGAFAYILLTNW